MVSKVKPRAALIEMSSSSKFIICVTTVLRECIGCPIILTGIKIWQSYEGLNAFPTTVVHFIDVGPNILWKTIGSRE